MSVYIQTLMILIKFSLSAANDVLVQYAPSFHGLYRAIISSPFSWSIEEWTELTSNLQSLLLPEVVDQLNDLLPDFLQGEENDPEESRFVQIFLARYVNRDRPLTGYFIVCCLMEIIWTVLAQTLSPPPQAETISFDAVALEEEAAAANRVWGRLMRKAIPDQDVADSSRDMLDKVSGYAIRCFTDLLMQIESMDTEPSLDTYAWETMSESLVRTLKLHLRVMFSFQQSETRLNMLCSLERNERRAIESCKTTLERRCTDCG